MISGLIFCFTFFTNAQTCDTYIQVVRNKPTIAVSYAQTLSRTIATVSVKHNIRPHIYTAILMQESGYNPKAVNKKSKDYGISQINERTIKAFKLSKKKILTDLAYAIESGAIVLSDFKKRHGKKEYFYWTRYNTSNKTKRLIYRKKVLRYL